MAKRSEVLADRIAQGAEQIAALAETLTDAQWNTPVLPDGRKAGVMIHHVANMYPLEVDIARKLGAGESIFRGLDGLAFEVVSSRATSLVNHVTLRRTSA